MKNKWKIGAINDGYEETYKLKKGINYIILAQNDYTNIYEHWYDDINGKRRRSNCVIPISKSRLDINSCPLCKALADGNNQNITTRRIYYFNVMIGKLKKIKNKRFLVFDRQSVLIKYGKTVGIPICEYGNEIYKMNRDSSYMSEIFDDLEKDWKDYKIKKITDLPIKI